MAISGGGDLYTQAIFDVQQVDKASAQGVQDLQRYIAVAQAVPDVKPKLDTADLDTKTKASTTNLTGLFAKLTGIPVGKVNLDVGGADQNASALNKTLTSLAKTAGVDVAPAIGSLTGVLGAGGLVAAAGAAAVALAALAKEHASYLRVLENTTGASGEAAKALKADFQSLRGVVPADGGDIAKAQSIIFQEFKATGGAARDLVKDLNAASRVLGDSLVPTTRAAVDVFLAWEVAADEQAETLRQLVRGAQLTGISYGELTAQLTKGAIAFRELGLTIPESIALLDALGDAGLPAKQVISALREAMNNAAKGGADTTTFFNDVLQVIKAYPDDAQAAAKAAEIFGEQAGPTMAKLIRSGRLEIQDMSEDIQETGKTLSSRVSSA